MAKRSPDSIQAFVALLRGVNVGGKNILPMAALVEMFAEAGCCEPRSFIQSGNILFLAPLAVAERTLSTVPLMIEKKFGFRPIIQLRSAAELQAIVQGNPLLAAGLGVEHLHVGFLAERPGKTQIAALNPDRSPGDRFAVVGREIYLHLSGGVGKTKLTSAYLDATLKTTCTLRNWRTVLKLRDLATGEMKSSIEASGSRRRVDAYPIAR